MQAANGQPHFALGSATSAFGQYNDLATGPSQHPGSKVPSMGGLMHSRQPALFKGSPQSQTSEESMSQQPQISSSSSEGAGQTAEASAALRSLYEIARSSQHDGASSRAPRLNYRRAEKVDKPERSPASDPEGIYAEALFASLDIMRAFCILYLPSATAIPNKENILSSDSCPSQHTVNSLLKGRCFDAGHTNKAVLSPRMKEQAAVVAAELSARNPADGVDKIAPFTRAEATEEGSPPESVSAAHPTLRQKTAVGSR